MPVPSNPTISEIVTEGLKRGGIVNPSTAQVTDATNHQFREVKCDIQTVAGRHPYLRTVVCSTLSRAYSRIALPTDADSIETVELVDIGNGLASTSTGWRSTAQGGAATTITLNASVSNPDTTVVIGRYIFLTSGTGANQYRQIVDYNDGTKVATVDSAWSTNPASGTGYVIGHEYWRVYDSARPVDIISIARQYPWLRALPRKAQLLNNELWFDVASDGIYPLLWTYYAHIDRLDDTGTVFTRFLREYRSLFIQGVAVKTMQRFDDERYLAELNVYMTMLNALAAKSRLISQQPLAPEPAVPLLTPSAPIAPQPPTPPRG